MKTWMTRVAAATAVAAGLVGLAGGLGVAGSSSTLAVRAPEKVMVGHQKLLEKESDGDWGGLVAPAGPAVGIVNSVLPSS